MNWSEFYLVCFLFGFGLSVLSLLGGSAHLHLPLALASRRCMCGRRRKLRGSTSRHCRGVSGVVRRHGLSAGALLRRVVRAGAG